MIPSTFFNFPKMYNVHFFPTKKNTTNAHAFSGSGSGLGKHAFSSKKCMFLEFSLFWGKKMLTCIFPKASQMLGFSFSRLPRVVRTEFRSGVER